MGLSKSEVLKYKKRLEDLREQMTNLVRGTNELVKTADEGKGYSQHQADEGTDDSIRNVNLEVSGKELKILRQIERALEKVEEGSYGICDVTEEDIPKPRLDAIPYATMTVKAQDQAEKGQI